MRAYLANKMTGKPQFNYPWFDEASAYLRGRGIDVVSPAEMDSPAVRAAALASITGDLADLVPSGETYGDILAADVKLIADGGLDAIIVGPEWHGSKGARLETFVAHQLGLPVLRYPYLEPVALEELVRAWIWESPVLIGA